MLTFSLKSTIPGPKTLSMLILDASSSMQSYRHAPQECVNKLLEDLRGDATATHITGLITFNDVYAVAIAPAPVATIRPYTTYQAEGNTLLYRTVKRTIEGLYDAWKILTPVEQAEFTVVIGVISDGEDNRSSTTDYPVALQEYSTMVRALGWKLHTYGVGINGKALARKMGFDEDLAITVEASVHGVEQSTRGHSHATRRPPPGQK